MHGDGIQILHDEAGARYVLELDGSEAGHLSYQMRDGRLALTHTEVDPNVGRRGLGSELARFALEDARRRSLAVLPNCSFVRSYIERHPEEYGDLVAAEDRRRFGLG